MRGEAGASVPIFYSDLKPNPTTRAHVRGFQKSRPPLTIPILSSPSILLHRVTPANHANQAALEGDFPSARRVESMGVGHAAADTGSGCLQPQSGTKSPSFQECYEFCNRPVSEIVLICDVGHFHAAKELIKGILG